MGCTHYENYRCYAGVPRHSAGFGGCQRPWKNLFNVIIAVSIFSIPTFARVVRGSTLAVRKLEYIDAMRSLGASDGRIIFGHILPNITSLSSCRLRADCRRYPDRQRPVLPRSWRTAADAGVGSDAE